MNFFPYHDPLQFLRFLPQLLVDDVDGLGSGVHGDHVLRWLLAGRVEQRHVS